MENVWNYLRSNKLCTLLWDSYEAIVDACTGAWHFLINDSGAHSLDWIQDLGACHS